METDLLKNQIICIESGSRGKGGALTEGIPSVGAEHLQGDGLITWNPNKMKYISPVFFKSLKSGILQKGDVLIVKDGATTGKVAYVSQLPSCAAINEHVFLLRSKPTLYSKFLFYYLQSPVGNHKVMKYYHGATVGGIGKNIVNLEIPLPPLDEQRRIAAVLDKVTGLIAKRRQQLEMLDELVKARFVEMFGDSNNNPHSLPILKWNDVFNTTTGKLDSNASVENAAYPFFTCSKETLRIDKYAFDQEALLLAGNNAAGKYDVKYYCGKFNAYQRTYVLSLKQNWSYSLFKFQLENKLEYLEQHSLGGLTKYLTLKILGELEFIIPEMEEQDRFTAFAERIDKIKTTINHSLEKLETLKKALMQEYFG